MQPHFDRSQVQFHPLSERPNKVFIERDHIPPGREPVNLSTAAGRELDVLAERLRRARSAGRSRVLAFGAHTIKNGLAPVIIRLLETGWLTHIATNGAGVIHDWEFAYQGASSEDVRANVARGRFGIWAETGLYLNLAIAAGAYAGLGYGESVGAMVDNDGLTIPSREELADSASRAIEDPDKAGAAADLMVCLDRAGAEPGRLEIRHPYKRFGLQAAAYRLGVPFTSHPMFGHDIIYAHPASAGGAIGRAAERDFLRYAQAIAGLSEGVYMSIGSAVMSPMIFEKSLSMARNVARQRGETIEGHYIFVGDLQPSTWDWRAGEPPEDSPDYYLRYCKTFARMGGEMRYVSADNRDVLCGLLQRLESRREAPR